MVGMPPGTSVEPALQMPEDALSAGLPLLGAMPVFLVLMSVCCTGWRVRMCPCWSAYAI